MICLLLICSTVSISVITQTVFQIQFTLLDVLHNFTTCSMVFVLIYQTTQMSQINVVR